jgi:hypothetical protein
MPRSREVRQRLHTTAVGGDHAAFELRLSTVRRLAGAQFEAHSVIAVSLTHPRGSGTVEACGGIRGSADDAAHRHDRIEP